MKTKIVYCLVSNNKDYYYEQLLISLCSLRKHNPDAVVEVFCDQETFTTLTGNRCGIFEYNIHVIPIEVPEDWKKLEKSRYLKTNLRKLTHGDYLYVDTDTVICSSLDFVDDYPFEIAAVYDSHLENPLPKFKHCKYKSQRWIWNNAKKSSANIEGCWHFNSGVIFARDSLMAHELYTKWFDHYQKQLKYGVKVDQLPLLMSNKDMGNVIMPLDWKLNCQVPFDGIRSKASNAKIIHYFPTKKTTLLSSSWILDPIKEAGCVNASIQRIIEDPGTFFVKLSGVVIGDAANLIFTTPLSEAYNSCPKVFCLFVKGLRTYLTLKKLVYRIIHS